jgi:hypothetical protein
MDAPFILVAHVVVALEAHPALGELVDRLLDVVHREVQDRVRGRHMIRLRVDQGVPVAREVQGQQAVALGDLQAECPAVERLGGLDVVHGEAAERLCRTKHGHPSG